MKLTMTSLVAAGMLASTQAAIVIPSTHAVSKTLKVEYRCSFGSSWSSRNQPLDYPDNAYSSAPVFVAHSNLWKLFTPGNPVGAGVQEVAENGNPEVLLSELEAAGDAIKSYIVGVDMFYSPIEEEEEPVAISEASGGGRRLQEEPEPILVTEGGEPIVGRYQTNTQYLTFDPEHSFFSSISMLTPSPDWFSASHGTQAITQSEDGEDVWVKQFKYETRPYDAGTDSGVTFTSPNDPTVPQGVAEQFTIDSPLTDSGIFVNPEGDAVLPINTWECTLVKVKYTCEFDPECMDGMEDTMMTETNNAEGAMDSAGSWVGTALAAAAVAGSYLLL